MLVGNTVLIVRGALNAEANFPAVHSPTGKALTKNAVYLVSSYAVMPLTYMVLWSSASHGAYAYLVIEWSDVHLVTMHSKVENGSRANRLL